MTRRLPLVLFAAILGVALACQKGGKSGPVVAKGKGVVITADEMKARLDEQSPFIRARYTTLDRKKEFLDNMIRFEVLAHEAERQGLDKDPEVLDSMRKVMVQKLVQRTFRDPGDVKDVPEADIQGYYDSHKDEFIRATRYGVAQIFFKAEPGSPDRAKKLAKAKQLATKLRDEDKKNAMAFSNTAREASEDDQSKVRGGDLGFKTQADLETLFNPDIAKKIVSMKPPDLTEAIESPKGIHIFKLLSVQEGYTTTLDNARRQIALRLNREKRTKEFDEFVKKLRAEAAVSVNDAELDKVPVNAAVPGTAPNPHAPAPGMIPPAAPPRPGVVAPPRPAVGPAPDFSPSPHSGH